MHSRLCILNTRISCQVEWWDWGNPEEGWRGEGHQVRDEILIQISKMDGAFFIWTLLKSQKLVAVKLLLGVLFIFPDGKVLGGKKIDIQILMAIFNLNKNIGNWIGFQIGCKCFGGRVSEVRDQHLKNLLQVLKHSKAQNQQSVSILRMLEIFKIQRNLCLELCLNQNRWFHYIHSRYVANLGTEFDS